MESSLPFSRMCPILALAFLVLVLPISGQISTTCTPSMLSSFTPCMNFVTNSTANGTTPTPTKECCGSLKNLTSTSMGCACLIVTGSVPFQIPINRSLAISLPRACNMPGVPLQCKASASPVPAPGPIALAPTLSPGISPPGSPEASPVVPEPTSSAPTPESDTTPALTPPTGETGTAGTTPSSAGSRPVLTPPSSAAMPSYSFSPALLLAALGYVLFKFN